MKMDMTSAPESVLSPVPMVGDILEARGGRGDTSAWVVAAIRQSSVHLFGVNTEGEIVSTITYGMHYVITRKIIGHCATLRDMTFPIEWTS